MASIRMLLRFYEKKGLLASRRLTNGYRVYGEQMSEAYCRKFCCIAQ
ncbi:MAG: MerR family DNA-binding transcriptional regulator [Ruminococcus sp.]